METVSKVVGINIPDSVFNAFRIEEYHLYLKIQGLAYETQRYYIKYLKNFIEYAEFKDISSFNNFVSLRYSYYKLSDKQIKNNTINKYYKCLRKYYQFLKEYGEAEEILIDKLQKVKTTNSLPSSLSDEEIQQIRNYLQTKNKKYIDIRDYVIFETFLNTGIRRAELANLKIEDVSSKYILVKNGKGGKDRMIYISNLFSKVLGSYIDLRIKKGVNRSECVFGGLSLDGVSLVIKRISRASKIHFSPHLLRHTYASLCVKKGINLYTLQQQMGHSDLKTTSIYLYLNGKENWEEIQKLSI